MRYVTKTEAMNLDYMSTEDLRALIPTLASDDPRREYVKLALRARSARLSGDINKALFWESECERLYARLPYGSRG